MAGDSATAVTAVRTTSLFACLPASCRESDLGEPALVAHVVRLRERVRLDRTRAARDCVSNCGLEERGRHAAFLRPRIDVEADDRPDAVLVRLSDFGVKIEPITAAVARAAALLRSRRQGLRLPDALVLATADEVSANRVLTGDESWTKISRRVTIVRPGSGA